MILTKIKAARTIDAMKWARFTAVMTIGVCNGALDSCVVVVFSLVASSDTFGTLSFLGRGQALHKGFGGGSISC